MVGFEFKNTIIGIQACKCWVRQPKIMVRLCKSNAYTHQENRKMQFVRGHNLIL